MNLAKKAFGARLKEIRTSKKLSQEQLAEIVNMESRQISRIETGSSFTTIENLSKIANALNVDISSLFCVEHKKDKNSLKKEVIEYIDSANQEQIELIYKLVKAILL